MDNPLYSLFDMISSDNYPKPPGQEKYETWDMRDSESNQGILRLLHNIINPVGEISEDNTFTPTDPAALLSVGGILDLLGRKVGKSAKLVKKLTGPSANTNIKNIPIKNMSPDSQDIPIWRVHNTPSPSLLGKTKGKTREEVEIQGGPLSRKFGDTQIGRILDDHGIKWEYHDNGGITAIEEFSRGASKKKYFKPNTTLKTLRDWLGY